MIEKRIKEKEKMTINSPFRYAGGKFYARKLILENIPKHTTYIEPFCGGASIFFAKQKVRNNWLNDIDKELINCYIQIRDNVQGMINFLKDEKASKERHAYYKNEFKPTNDLERAARWFYMNRTSYSGIMKFENCYWGYGDKYSMRPENWGNHLSKVSKKLQKVKITCLDFEEVIKKARRGAFLFIDPPYFNADQDKFYTYSFALEDHQKLAEVLKKNRTRFKFLLTYDDSEKIREMYSWCKRIEEKEWNYTINRTDDQTKKTDKKGKRDKGQEIFIMNYAEESQTKIADY